MSTSTGGALETYPPLTTLSQYACANYPYTLHYTVFTDYVTENYVPGSKECAAPWIDSPSMFEEWSKSVATEMSTATIQDFANPFDQVIARPNFSASTVLPLANSTTFAPTVRIPTAPSATSTTTTSAGVRWVVSPKTSVYILSLLFAGRFLLS